MVGVLGHEHMREETGAGATALDRHGRRGRLHDALARAAAEARADVTHDPERGGDVVELLGHVLAHAPHRAAAVGAHARRLVQHVLARQVVGERLAMRLGEVPRSRDCGRNTGGRFGLGLFQSELQLVRFARQALGRAAERHASEPGDLHPQLLQLRVRDHQHGLQQAHIVGQRGGVEQHDRLYQSGTAHARKNGRKPCFLPGQRRL